MILSSMGAIIGLTLGLKGLCGFVLSFAIIAVFMTISEFREHGLSDSYTINGHRPFVEPLVVAIILGSLSVILFIL